MLQSPVLAFDDPTCNASCLFYPVEDDKEYELATSAATAADTSPSTTRRQMVGVDLRDASAAVIEMEDDDDQDTDMEQWSSSSSSMNVHGGSGPSGGGSGSNHGDDHDSSTLKRPAPQYCIKPSPSELRSVKRPRHDWSSR